MQIDIDDREARMLIDALRKIPRAMTRPLWDALRRGAGEVAADTRAMLRRQSRTPSAPGEPPARQSGLLARSIRTRRGQFFSYAVMTQPDAFYGRFLETGTGARRTRRGVSRGRLEPRPFLTAALAGRADEIEQAIGEALTRVIAEAGTVRLR